MNFKTFYQSFKKPMVLGLFTFVILLISSQYIAYQKYLINENDQKKEIDNQVNFIKEKLQALVMYSHSATRTLAYIVERNGVPRDFDSIAIELLEGHDYFDVVQLVDGDGFIITDQIKSEALQINVTFSSKDENTYKRKLIITDECTNTTVAEFTVYAESIEEDERLRVMTQNMGYNVIASDSTVFRETNLKEFYNLIYQYQNDCLVAAVEYNKNYYSDGDLKPSEELFFSLTIVPFSNVNSPNIRN